MKILINPVLLLAVMLLIAWKILADETIGEHVLAQPDIWILSLCVTGCVVNGALSIAKAMTHRAPIMGVMWSVAFLVLGCCAWVLISHGDVATREEARTYAQMKQAWKNRQANPLDINEQGHSLTILAATLGKKGDLQQLLQLPVPAEQKVTAAFRAAEMGKKETLAILLQTAGVSPNSEANGSTLLCTAICQGRKETAAFLLRQGALVNQADAEGMTPLMHAVINEDTASVRLLLEHKADTSITTPAGRDAASYSRTEAISDLLAL